jgi:hypothetical protein
VLQGEQTMTIEIIRAVLGWCIIINMGILCGWFLFFMLARDWMYTFHGKWFRLSEEQFDGTHYAAMAIYKLAIWLFVIVPYLALCIVG